MTKKTTDPDPWHFVALPHDHLHPLTFLRPDVILRVHELWSTGRHNDRTFRSFSLPDATNFRPPLWQRFPTRSGAICPEFDTLAVP
jgi:hypothetical protein